MFADADTRVGELNELYSSFHATVEADHMLGHLSKIHGLS